MRLPQPFWAVAAASLFNSCAAAATSNKRGLIFTPNGTWPQDNYIWTRASSDLSWYYNYGSAPSPVYSNLSQDVFEFVPMLWGAPDDTSDTTFLSAVKALITDGTNVSHVMTFNEPDLSSDYGGSNLSPAKAAEVWVSNIIPLQKFGVKVGLPALSGGWNSVPWLTQLLGNCSELISTSGTTKNCTYDFVPLHWYGSFEGLASHIGTYSAAFPNTSLWVTEYNYDNQDLFTTQSFFNTSVDYLDSLTSIERYAYFGAFRSTASNVGPNAAMLSAGGELTDIGLWYLGEAGQGAAPNAQQSTASRVLDCNMFTLAMLACTLVSCLVLVGA